MKPIKVLHLTAHLGGGVGKALSGLAMARDGELENVKRTLVCAEAPEKDLFVDKVLAAGCDVLVTPTVQAFRELLADADVVQLEWWNHPETIRLLVEKCSVLPHRLLVWAHISGLGSSLIPPQLIAKAGRFCFTSHCSLESAQIQKLSNSAAEKLDVVSSGGGFDDLDPGSRMPSANLRAGYVGTLNFSKLHPEFVQYLSAVDIPGFQVKMIGDEVNRRILEEQCQALGRPQMLHFSGFSSRIAGVMAEMDVLVYLLNPSHYGTAENALLEAMAMGVVPVVMGNPAEKHIVSDQVNGLVVNSPAEFAAAVRTLAADKSLLQRLSANAQVSVRERFDPQRSARQLFDGYRQLLDSEKRALDYGAVFGASPEEWFLSCQPAADAFRAQDWGRLTHDHFARHALFERTKGSVHHFSRAFPDSPQLSDWSAAVRAFEHAD